MTKNERERMTRQENNLLELGFNFDEAESLRRISMTLRRWFALECGTDHGCIERDDATGKPYWVTEVGNPRAGFRRVQTLIADREAGAMRRLSKIMHAVNERRFVGDSASTLRPNCDDLTTYIQSDPRGAALYILRPGDIPAGSSVESCYTNGLCVF